MGTSLYRLPCPRPPSVMAISANYWAPTLILNNSTTRFIQPMTRTDSVIVLRFPVTVWIELRAQVERRLSTRQQRRFWTLYGPCQTCPARQAIRQTLWDTRLQALITTYW